MIGIDEARQRISEAARLLEVVEADVAEARGRALAEAVPAEPDTIAPAWPMVFPSGAVNPAT